MNTFKAIFYRNLKNSFSLKTYLVLLMIMILLNLGIFDRNFNIINVQFAILSYVFLIMCSLEQQVVIVGDKEKAFRTIY